MRQHEADGTLLLYWERDSDSTELEENDEIEKGHGILGVQWGTSEWWGEGWGGLHVQWEVEQPPGLWLEHWQQSHTHEIATPSDRHSTCCQYQFQSNLNVCNRSVNLPDLSGWIASDHRGCLQLGAYSEGRISNLGSAIAQVCAVQDLWLSHQWLFGASGQ